MVPFSTPFLVEWTHKTHSCLKFKLTSAVTAEGEARRLVLLLLLLLIGKAASIVVAKALDEERCCTAIVVVAVDDLVATLDARGVLALLAQREDAARGEYCIVVVVRL